MGKSELKSIAERVNKCAIENEVRRYSQNTVLSEVRGFKNYKCGGVSVTFLDDPMSCSAAVSVEVFVRPRRGDIYPEMLFREIFCSSKFNCNLIVETVCNRLKEAS